MSVPSSSLQPRTHPAAGPQPPGAGRVRRAVRVAMRGAAETADPLDFGQKLATLATAIRWSAILIGFLLGWVRGEADSGFVVTSVALALFALLQTLRAPDLEFPDPTTRRIVVLELVLSGAALAATGGVNSPFALVPVVPCTVAGFVWGLRAAAGIAVGGAFAAVVVIVAQRTDPEVQRAAAQLGIVFLLCGALGALARALVQEVEERHSAALDQLTRMATANDLLVSLHGIAQTLPASLDLGEVLDSIRQRLRSLLEFTALTVIVRDETAGVWRVELAEGVRLPSALDTADLPSALHDIAIGSARPLLVDDMLRSPLMPCAALARSGLYAPLRARGNLVGLLAIEHSAPGRYDAAKVDLLASLASLFALAVDNALWFARLRRFGAEAERARIARELHDSIAQSLAYIAFELERLAEHEEDARGTPGDLTALHDVVRGVVTELRETLYELRSTVTEDADLATTAARSLERFTERTGISVDWNARVERRLPHQVEQEIWRILQEALTNIERHANAKQVRVHWTVDERGARLVVQDDGRGFVPRTVEGEHYGLLGMRERADAISAQFTVDSLPGSGTRLAVDLPR